MVVETAMTTLPTPTEEFRAICFSRLFLLTSGDVPQATFRLGPR